MAKRQTRVFSARCAFLTRICYCRSSVTHNPLLATSGAQYAIPANLPIPQAVVTLHNLDENTNRAESATKAEDFSSKTSSPDITRCRAPSPDFPNPPRSRWN